MQTRPDEELNGDLLRRLELLQPYTQRRAEVAADGREKFLTQAEEFRSKRMSQQAVSLSLTMRLKGWISDLIGDPICDLRRNIEYQRLHNKERFVMLTTITTILVAFSILFGGAGAAVYAAQDSMPNDLFYGVKLTGEDIHLQLTGPITDQLTLTLEYTNRRATEIATIIAEDEDIPPRLQTRYREQLNFALGLAARLDDAGMSQALEKIRASLHQQERVLTQAMANAPEHAGLVMNQVREMIRAQILMVDLGLENPLAYRLLLQQQLQYQNSHLQPPWEPSDPGDGGPGPGPDHDAGPGPNDPAGEGPKGGPGGPEDKPGDCDPPCDPAKDGTGSGSGSNATPGDEDDPPNQDSGGNDPDKTPPGDGGKEPGAGDAKNPGDPPDTNGKGSG